ncbi:MAG: hypothetical protein HC767_02420 [Akkermansiaceae bacterium]|nr:hypothetical protein [Akkermansiaceae bacterium]
MKQFTLRDQEQDRRGDPMIAMEKARRLHGAISLEERRKKLGQYYTLAWNDSANSGQGAPKLVFQYQQGATGSRVKRMTTNFPATSVNGTAEFAVIGDDYFKGGKVLAWKAILLRGDREIASQQSYLWR